MGGVEGASLIENIRKRIPMFYCSMLVIFFKEHLILIIMEVN
jgi:hypothetical protein